MDALFERFGLQLRTSDDYRKVSAVWRKLANEYGPAMAALVLRPGEALDELRKLPMGRVGYIEAVLKGDKVKAKHFAVLLQVENLDTR